MTLISSIVSSVGKNITDAYHDLVNQAADIAIKTVGGLSSIIQGVKNTNIFGNTTLYDTIISTIESKPRTDLGYITSFNSTFVQGNRPFSPPTNQDLTKTPTVKEFLQSAISADLYNAIPEGAKPFLYNDHGQSLQLGITDAATGMSARVWTTAENQIIITYQGTGGGETGLRSLVTSLSQIFQDASILSQNVTPGEKEAVKFAQFVVQEAGLRGYTPNNIFVTGHSLGGIEAEYVAQQTGLAGIGFNATGLPKDSSAKGDGSNFINVLKYGDPVSSLASDVEGEQPFAPAFDPINGVLPHYGHNVFIGSPEDQQWLSSVSRNEWAAGTIIGKIQAASDYFLSGFRHFHAPYNVANNFNDITLGMQTFSINNGQTSLAAPGDAELYLDGMQQTNPAHGAPLNAADKSIAQFLAYDSTRTDYHSAYLT